MIEKKRRLERGLLPILAGIIATFAVLGFQITDPFGIATLTRERSFDFMYALFPRACCQNKVVVVDIDNRSLTQLGGWPLPRTVFAGLTTRIGEPGPAALAFDIFFASGDRHSPRVLASELSKTPGGDALAPLTSHLQDNDALFADALHDAPTVLAGLAGPGSNKPPLNFIKAEGLPDARSTVLVDAISGPFPQIAEAALGVGISSLWGEDGGIVRRVPLILRADALLAPGLALETSRLAANAALLDADFEHMRLRYAAKPVRLGEGGTMRIRFSDPSHWAARTISAVDILEGRADKSRFKDSTVFVGSSAPEAGALRPTPVSPLTPSVQIQAEAAEELAEGVAPYRPGLAFPIELCATLILGLLATWAATRLSVLRASGAIVTILAAWVVASFSLFLDSDRLVDPFWPGMGAAFAGNVAAATAFARTQKLKALISQKFTQYLAPDVVRAILDDPSRLRSDGEMREVTALFTDIGDFTRLTQLPPQKLLDLLDAYFDGVCRIVSDHKGMVDLIVGDAVHAFFNMPLDLPGHADAAIDCALAISSFAKSFQQTPRALEAHFGRTRIGIETGPAIVGDVGGPGRFNYTAHGPAANAAARLESANKDFGTTICIGAGTQARITRHSLRLIGQRHLRGFAQPTKVYTVGEPSQ